jgi:dsDNA-specific endonuclease/ATPase MutS2
MTKDSINRRVVRVLQSRVRSFTARIEIEKHKRFVLDAKNEIDNLFVHLVTQTTRIANYFARRMNCVFIANVSQT